MSEMYVVNLQEVTEAVSKATKPVNILWQQPDSVAFVARGRPGRSEFHIDPSDEVMYVIKGTLELHYITPEGERKVATLKEGEVVYCPAGTPHSPHFAPDAFLFVLERQRHTDEDDRFIWYCDKCGAQVYETSRYVPDYHMDPVSRVYEEFYGSEANRTCKQCGHVAPLPEAQPAAR